jgi:ABC-type iron transport system FetAB ATPase subunit
MSRAAAAVRMAPVPLCLAQLLRGSISLIPQTPDLFAGTVRYNLDPFQRFDDRLLLASLRDAQLNHVALDDKVSCRWHVAVANG